MSRRTAALAFAAMLVGVIAIFGWPSAGDPGDPPAQPTRVANEPEVELRTTVIVRVTAGGSPVPGAAVMIQESAEHPIPSLASALTGNDGTASLSVPRGAWHLVVAHRELARHRARLDAQAELVELTVALERGVRIEGSVVDSSGRAVSDATVRALKTESDDEVSHQKTGSDGTFSLPGLDPRSYRLYVHSGRHRPRWEGPIDFTSHGEVRRLVVRLEDGRTIAGRVVDADGRPIAGASVGSADDGSSIVSSDEQGRYELAGLGEFPVSLFATAPGFGATHLRGVAPGKRNVEIVLERAASLDGRLTLGEGVSRVMISVCRHDEWFDKEICVARRLYEPPEPTFALANLPPGAFELVVEAEGHRTARVPVTLLPGQNITVQPVVLSPETLQR